MTCFKDTFLPVYFFLSNVPFSPLHFLGQSLTFHFYSYSFSSELSFPLLKLPAFCIFVKDILLKCLYYPKLRAQSMLGICLPAEWWQWSKYTLQSIKSLNFEIFDFSVIFNLKGFILFEVTCIKWRPPQCFGNLFQIGTKLASSMILLTLSRKKYFPMAIYELCQRS